MKFSQLLFVSIITCLSCNNRGTEVNTPLDGGNCTYRTSSAIYTIDSLEIIDDTIRTVFFESNSLDYKGELLRTKLSLISISQMFYKKPIALNLDSILTTKTHFRIVERFIETGACHPYALDEFQIVK